MQQLTIGDSQSEIGRLRQKPGQSLPNIESGQSRPKHLRRLEDRLFQLTTSDVSVVVFGSLARDEFATKSDVDWTALIDGVADPTHLKTAHGVKQIIEELVRSRHRRHFRKHGVQP
jgi:predicted nucleotidyltransferase